MVAPLATVLLLNDHLHRNYGALKEATPATHQILFIESERMLTTRTWHLQRLFFLISSRDHFLQQLKDEGFQVTLIRSADTASGIAQYRSDNPSAELIAAEPSSHQQLQQFQELGITLIPNNFFLTPRPLFAQWAGAQKSLVMENFYRAQRQRLNILMEGADPVGGRWNYDADNRLPPPKGKHQWPPYLEHARDEIDKKVLQEIANRKLPVYGDAPDTTWGTTRAAALEQLNHFLDKAFAEFGAYEDAMTTQSWAVNHSLLSPYLNVGLLHAEEVVTAALKRFKKGDIPLAGAEGFIRQIIGWREYINGLYWFFGDLYRAENSLAANRPLLPLFEDSTKTKMNCVSTNVRDIEARAWVHHIPRLMVLSNLALITGTSPQEFLDWMRRSFIDAADWVMVPNVIGMSLHADGGKLATKPYASGGSYISKMSNYCKSCPFDPKKRVGEDACPFTTLYWDFLARHRDRFAKNHRMAQQLAGINRLSDLPQLQERAQEVLDLLSRGEL
ncbi:Photolyase PhrB-like [Candidatus Nanopelagicaceae bacterium]